MGIAPAWSIRLPGLNGEREILYAPSMFCLLQSCCKGLTREEDAWSRPQ